MHWFSRKDQDPATPPSKANNNNHDNPSSRGKKPRRRLLGKIASKTSPDKKNNSNTAVVAHHYDEGVEISLSQDASAFPHQRLLRLLRQQHYPLDARSMIITTNKTQKLQFSVEPSTQGPLTTIHIQQIAQEDKIECQHRVPLSEKQPAQPNHQEELFLLRSFEPSSEKSAIQYEIKLLDQEIQHLEEDRRQLAESTIHPSMVTPVSELTSLTSTDISSSQRDAIRELRGNTFTVALASDTARDVFGSKCGFARSKNSNPCTATPTQCRHGGAATTISHVEIMCPHSTNEEASFLICRDQGKAFHHGHLPERLFRRIKQSGFNPRAHASNLVYLATGPLGSYFAEFRSGECWWGCGVDDEDFHRVCREWNVHRVSFGPATVFDEEDGSTRHYISSWIVISRDGRVAFKNIPSRLKRLLENRVASDGAPVEVSLGGKNTYFIRFLDGFIDYVLPRQMADQCATLETAGAKITSVSVQSQLPRDYVIRSTEP